MLKKQQQQQQQQQHETKPGFTLDCDRFAAEQLRQRHISNVYRLTREERLRIVDPE